MPDKLTMHVEEMNHLEYINKYSKEPYLRLFGW